MTNKDKNIPIIIYLNANKIKILGNKLFIQIY